MPLKSQKCNIATNVKKKKILRLRNADWDSDLFSSELSSSFCLDAVKFTELGKVPTPRYGQYLTHAHSHITQAVAAMDSCFFSKNTAQHLPHCFSSKESSPPLPGSNDEYLLVYRAKGKPSKAIGSASFKRILSFKRFIYNFYNGVCLLCL